MNQNARTKGNLESALEYWKRTPLNIFRDERKKIKRLSLTKAKAFQNQALKLETHPRDKNFGGASCKILLTILEVDEGRT